MDLGCATGRELLTHTGSFKELVGFDISPHMVARATEKARTLGHENVGFTVHDLENGIPLADASTSCVFMNQGTGSDVRDIGGVIAETNRILRPGGRFLFSFFNVDALVFRTFLPWPLSLISEIDLASNSTRVHCPGRDPNPTTGDEGEPGTTFSVYSKAYRKTEAEALFTGQLKVTGSVTYPTISTILPDHLFDDKAVVELVAGIDADLQASSRSLGAYIIITGEKA